MGVFCSEHNDQIKDIAKIKNMTEQQGVDLMRVYEKIDHLQDKIDSVSEEVNSIKVSVAKMPLKLILTTTTIASLLTGIITGIITVVILLMGGS